MATICKMRKSDHARCKISTSACKANLDRMVRPPKLRISTETETVQNAKCWIRTSEDAVWCAHSLGTLRDSKSKQKKIRWGQGGPSTQVEEPLFHQPRTSQSHCALVTQYTQSLKSREPWMLIKLAEWHNIGLRVNWLWTLRSLAVPLFIESYRHRWPIFLIIVIIHDLSFIYISYNYNIIYRVNKCKIDFIHLVFTREKVGYG